MLLAGITEGVGLLLLLPMLALIGVLDAGGASEPIAAHAESVLNGFGRPLNLYSASGAFLVLLTIRQWVLFRQGNHVALIELQYANSIRDRLFDALQHASWRFVSQQRLSDYVHTLTQVSDLAGQAGYGLLRCISISILLVAQFTIAVLLAPVLTLLAVAALSLLFYAFGDRISTLFASGKKINEHREDVHTAINNFMALMRNAKFAAGDDYMGRRFRSKTHGLAAQMAIYVRRYETSRSIIYLGAAVSLCLFTILAVEVFAISSARVLILVLIFARLIPNAMQLYQESHRLVHQLPLFEHASEAISACRSHAEPVADASRQRILPSQRVSLKAVTVTLGDPQSQLALHQVTAELPVGSCTALVGPTGAGKSTFAEVLSGLILPDDGYLCIDGTALDQQSTIDWRQSVGYVHQNAVLMSGSVRENLTWSTPDVSDHDIDKALQVSCADRFVSNLPDGLATSVGESGRRFSGGEQQRLSIAREILRKPALLILDEATNALDVGTALQIVKNLREFDTDMTILLITHQQAVASAADSRLILEAGVIVDVSQQFVATADKLADVIGMQS